MNSQRVLQRGDENNELNVSFNAMSWAKKKEGRWWLNSPFGP